MSLKNENVNREATSVSMLQDVRQPTRRKGHRNLRPKTFMFREAVWTTFFQLNYWVNPATSAAALKRKRERARERMREWKKQHPVKVLQQKKSYRERNKDKWSDELKRWRIKNPEKVRTQKHRYRERKANEKSIPPRSVERSQHFM